MSTAAAVTLGVCQPAVHAVAAAPQVAESASPYYYWALPERWGGPFDGMGTEFSQPVAAFSERALHRGHYVFKRLRWRHWGSPRSVITGRVSYRRAGRSTPWRSVKIVLTDLTPSACDGGQQLPFYLKYRAVNLVHDNGATHDSPAQCA